MRLRTASQRLTAARFGTNSHATLKAPILARRQCHDERLKYPPLPPGARGICGREGCEGGDGGGWNVGGGNVEGGMGEWGRVECEGGEGRNVGGGKCVWECTIADDSCSLGRSKTKR